MANGLWHIQRNKCKTESDIKLHIDQSSMMFCFPNYNGNITDWECIQTTLYPNYSHTIRYQRTEHGKLEKKKEEKKQQ